jgi:hypothetical protein
MLTDADMPPGYVLVRSTPHDLDIVDRANPTLGIGSTRDDLGTLKFVIRAKDEDDGSRSVVRGKVLFQLILSHYANHTITTVATHWSDESTNLAEFNQLIGSGLSEEDAARGTWTGLQLVPLGFTRVEFVEKIGPRWPFALVRALFTR